MSREKETLSFARTIVSYRLGLAIAIGAVLILAGEYVGYASWIGNDLRAPVRSILLAFGSTAAGAGFVGMVLDIALHAQHRSEVESDIARIKRNVFAAVYARDIPARLISRIQQNVLSANFTREKYTISQTLTRINKATDDPDDDYLMVECSVSYTVRNTRDEEAEYPVILEYMNAPTEEMQALSKLDFIRVDATVYPGDELKPDRSKNKPGFTRYEVPAKLGRHGATSVHMAWKEVRDLDDHMSWFALDLCDELTLTLKLNDPKSSNELQFGVYPLHPVSGTIVPQARDTLYCRIDDVVLPYQGFLAWWKLSKQYQNRRSFTSE